MFSLFFITECGAGGVGVCETWLSPKMFDVQIANYVTGEHEGCACQWCFHPSSKTLVPVFPFLAHQTHGRYTEGVADRKWGVQVGCMGV